MNRIVATLALLPVLAACTTPAATVAPDPTQVPNVRAGYVDLPEPTRILDTAAAKRLKNNSGITLQWIGWDNRGNATVEVDDRGVWRLTGRQRSAPVGNADAPARLDVDGRIVEIGADYFILSGSVLIDNTPDPGRYCLEERGDWRFAVTGNRKYWRLREFEWCDELTDYVDVYF